MGILLLRLLMLVGLMCTVLDFVCSKKRDEIDEDTSLVKLLSNQDDTKQLNRTTNERVQQVEKNINGGGFIGDDVPIRLPSTDFQNNDPLGAYEATEGGQLGNDVAENYANDKDDVNFQGNGDPNLAAKMPEDINAQKREEERYEATIMNPNPRPHELKKNETETFISNDITDLNQAEKHMEMEEGDAAKETDPKSLKLKAVTVIDAENKTNIVDTTEAQENEKENSSSKNNIKEDTESANFKNEDNAISGYTSSEMTNIIDAHHGLDSKNEDLLVLSEEERLSKRLNFLKAKIKQKQILRNNAHAQSDNIQPKARYINATNNISAKTKYIMRRIDASSSNEAHRNAAVSKPTSIGANEAAEQPLTIESSKSDSDNTHDENGNNRQNLQKKELFAFSYDMMSPFGPSAWQDLNPDWTCSGRKQSPINIDNRYILDDQIVKNMIVKVYPPSAPLTGVLHNNGHAPTLSLSNDVSVKLFGGTLTNDYYLKQLHFHFGCNSLSGSEHRIDGVMFPLELHLVFWDNSTFVSFPDAAKADRGIAVLSVLYQMEVIPYKETKHTPMMQIAQVLRHIEEEGDSITINEEFDFRLEKIIPNVINLDQTDRFFTYEGSLTTPGCYESVTWIVYATHPPVTESQLQIFRNLKSTKVGKSGRMCNNYRPVQKKHGRRIYSNIV